MHTNTLKHTVSKDITKRPCAGNKLQLVCFKVSESQKLDDRVGPVNVNLQQQAPSMSSFYRLKEWGVIPEACSIKAAQKKLNKVPKLT